MLKTDDDTVVDVERLLYWIDRKFSHVAAHYNESGAEFGILWRQVPVNRDPATKWYVPKKSYVGRVYPNYLNGPTYLLSGQAVRNILQVAPNVSAFAVEDILYTGVLAKEAGVAKRDVAGHFRRNLMVGVNDLRNLSYNNSPKCSDQSHRVL